MITMLKHRPARLNLGVNESCVGSRHQEELQRFWWEEQAELGARAAPKGATSAPLPEGEDSSATWQVTPYSHAGCPRIPGQPPSPI